MSNEIIIYQSSDGKVKIDVTMQGNTLWLSLNDMAELFERNKSTISRHIKNIFEEGELDENSVVAKNATTASDGKIYQVEYYNLDVIIAVGYRVKSTRGTQFRQWATLILHEYMQKGFSLNDELLKNLGGGSYWNELLERIRDIRASEKVLYRQVLDLYATSIDYDPTKKETFEFFKIVQNKLHYAVSGKTAGEIIFNRANANLPFMGLTSFRGKRPVKNEVTVAKNYMSEKELFALRRMVNAFFDMAELKASKHEPMYMKDWLSTLDKFCENFGVGILNDGGSVTHEDAVKKAYSEYELYRTQLPDELTDVEKVYLETLENMQKRLEQK